MRISNIISMIAVGLNGNGSGDEKIDINDLDNITYEKYLEYFKLERDEHEKPLREAIFLNTKEKIKQWNVDDAGTTTYGLNPFADAFDREKFSNPMLSRNTNLQSEEKH